MYVMGLLQKLCIANQTPMYQAFKIALIICTTHVLRVEQDISSSDVAGDVIA